MSIKKTGINHISDDSFGDITYKVFFDSAKFPMMLVNEDTTILLCNNAFEKLTGFLKDEVQDKMSWTLFIPDPDELEKMKEYHRLRRIDHSSVPEEYECGLAHRSGNKRDVAVSITMIPGTKKSLVFIQDITEKKRSEIWYKAVFENTGLPSIIIAPDTTIVKANTEWALLSGFSIEECEGKISWTDFVDKDDLTRMRDYHKTRRADSDGAPRKYEFRFIRRNGEVRNMINSVTMIPGYENSIASLMDITELKDAELDRKKLEEQLHQTRKLESIGQLAGGIAHDFNNMLAAILGYSQLIELKLDDMKRDYKIKADKLYKHSQEMLKHMVKPVNAGNANPVLLTDFTFIQECIKTAKNESDQLHKLNDMIKEIIKAADHAGGLTRQLLAFARKQTLEVKSLSLNKIVSDFEKMLRRTIRENVDIKIILPETLNCIQADAGQIEQIILNLALNAQDAMPDGGTLIIKTDNVNLDDSYAKTHDGVEAGDYVMLEMSDTGEGMNADTQSRIFEPFFTTKDPGRGTGLGMATVYGIVKQHGGNIWLYSEPGKGTTFHIYFPRAADMPEVGTSEKSITRDQWAETILVVEDQKQVREMTTMMLKEKGYNVIVADDGRKAVSAASAFTGKIDLLITDVIMPGLNGRELYTELLQYRPELEVLFISGYPGEIISIHGILKEGYNFLQKPVTIDVLSRKIREILEKNKNNDKLLV
jgi:PAS domain S-box-containing protein